VVAGSMHITLEISEQKRPPKTAIPRIWSENQEALIALPLASLVGALRHAGRAAGAGARGKGAGGGSHTCGRRLTLTPTLPRRLRPRRPQACAAR
jgi:hypothetical protein